jgi:hypothetical protein
MDWDFGLLIESINLYGAYDVPVEAFYTPHDFNSVNFVESDGKVGDQPGYEYPLYNLPLRDVAPNLTFHQNSDIVPYLMNFIIDSVPRTFESAVDRVNFEAAISIAVARLNAPESVINTQMVSDQFGNTTLYSISDTDIPLLSELVDNGFFTDYFSNLHQAEGQDYRNGLNPSYLNFDIRGRNELLVSPYRIESQLSELSRTLSSVVEQAIGGGGGGIGGGGTGGGGRFRDSETYNDNDEGEDEDDSEN